MIDEDKLKNKIEGLKSNLIHGACSSQIAMETRCKEEAYDEVISLLDSMQEEPVSEDLEEEVRKYLLDRKGYPHVMDETEKDIKKACIHFANWQKQKMMKDAVDGLVVCNNLTHWFKDIVMEIPSFLNVGDKVKLIILKED